MERCPGYEKSGQRVPLTIVLPSSATRTSGASLEIVPEKHAARRRAAARRDGLCLAVEAGSTRQRTLKSPACTAVTDQRNVFSRPG